MNMQDSRELLSRIHEYSLEDIMGERFGKYSKYIIQDRAIPDVRDGLKPVQRRIIFAMYRDHNTHDKQFKKCANAVGNVLGKFHPHGDSSVYDALVRMSQDWKQNHILVEIDGNNGSIDGDGPAAYRYTETRLAKISEELLKDIDKDTVLMAPNYSDTIMEPTVLPARFPNLLVNGASGISAGYATNIPTHNLGEIIDATIKRIDSPNCRLDTIMDIVKGPDFPTGGIVEGKQGIIDAFSTGKGKIVVKSRYEIVKEKNKYQIIIHEIPFEVNKALMIKKIDEIRIDKKIDGIQEVRDESDKKDNLRIAIDLKNDANPELIVNYLLKNTEMQINYNYNMVTIVNRTPKLLGIIPIIDAYINHQKDVVYKRTEFDLKFAKNKMHITEGIVKAISILDEVIATIRSSKNRQDSKENLIKKFEFTDAQAEAIITLQLYRLSNTDVTLLLEELEKLKQDVMHYNEILSDESKLMNVIKTELREIKKEYATPRKTDIVDEVTEIKIDSQSMIKEENTIVVLSNEGYLKRVSPKSYSTSDGETGLKAGDYILRLFDTNTLDKLVIITQKGNYLYIPVNEITEAKWKDLGKHISNIVTISPEEKAVSAYIINEGTRNNEVLLYTKKGQVMKTVLSNFEVTRYSKAMTVMKLKDSDEIISSTFNFGKSIMITNDNYYAYFDNEEIPLVNVRASGVKGISLKDNNVVSAYSFNNGYIGIFTNHKSAKRIKSEELIITGRAKRGNTLMKKVKTVNYETQFSVPVDVKNIIGIKTNGKIIDVKASEIPIMDLISTGSTIVKDNILDVFVYRNLEKNEKISADDKIIENDRQEEKVIEENKNDEHIEEHGIREMTIDDFLNDFKL